MGTEGERRNWLQQLANHPCNASADQIMGCECQAECGCALSRTLVGVAVTDGRWRFVKCLARELWVCGSRRRRLYCTYSYLDDATVFEEEGRPVPQGNTVRRAVAFSRNMSSGHHVTCQGFDVPILNFDLFSNPRLPPSIF